MTLLRILIVRFLRVCQKRRTGTELQEASAQSDMPAREHVRRDATVDGARAIARPGFGDVEQLTDAYRSRRALPAARRS